MGKFVDLIGRRFGRLEVIEYAGRNKHGGSRWKCQCDCGNVVFVAAGSLTCGLTKSCGCYCREFASTRRFNNLVGIRFGRLVAIKYVGKNKHGSYLWECICDCGNTVIIIGSSLTQNKTQSCGCLRLERITETLFKNIEGKKFGRLLVVEYNGKINDKSTWRCLCDCGNTVVANSDSLTSGNTKSCGCYNADLKHERRGSNHWNWKGGSTDDQYCDDWNEYLREYVRESFYRKCYLCELDESDNDEKLSVHHINYNKSDATLRNLVALCKPCHMQTGFYRYYWFNLLVCHWANNPDINFNTYFICII